MVQMSDWLGLTLAAMRRQYGRISCSQVSAGRFDRTLDLLERAIDVAPDSPPMLDVAWSILHGSQSYIPDEDDFDSNSTPIN